MPLVIRPPDYEQPRPTVEGVDQSTDNCKIEINQIDFGIEIDMKWNMEIETEIEMKIVIESDKSNRIGQT